eukprot:scaffold38713_cov37-Attheya_sp.AAC.1
MQGYDVNEQTNQPNKIISFGFYHISSYPSKVAKTQPLPGSFVTILYLQVPGLSRERVHLLISSSQQGRDVDQKIDGERFVFLRVLAYAYAIATKSGSRNNAAE